MSTLTGQATPRRRLPTLASAMDRAPDLTAVTSRLWTPRASLASCVRAVMLRDARGIALDDWQRLSYFPASPLCSISWWFGDSAGERVGGPFPEREATPDDPRTPLPAPLLVGGPFSAPSVTFTR